MTRLRLSACCVVFVLACNRGGVPGPEPCAVPGLPNCTRSGDVIIAGQPSPATLRYLASEGVTTVVSTRGIGEANWNERAAVEAVGMRYVEIPMPYPILGITDAQVAALDSALTAAGGPVLLHCNSGNRVAGLWGVWLAERRGLAAGTALDFARRAGMGNVGPVVERRIRGR